MSAEVGLVAPAVVPVGTANHRAVPLLRVKVTLAVLAAARKAAAVAAAARVEPVATVPLAPAVPVVMVVLLGLTPMPTGAPPASVLESGQVAVVVEVPDTVRVVLALTAQVGTQIPLQLLLRPIQEAVVAVENGTVHRAKATGQPVVLVV